MVENSVTFGIQFNVVFLVFSLNWIDQYVADQSAALETKRRVQEIVADELKMSGHFSYCRWD